MGCQLIKVFKHRVTTASVTVVCHVIQLQSLDEMSLTEAKEIPSGVPECPCPGPMYLGFGMLHTKAQAS